MKKKIFIGIIVVVILAIATFVAITLFKGDSSKDATEEREKISDLFVGYVDLEQLATKGAFGQYLNEDNRRLLTTIISANIEDERLRNHAAAIMGDFNASGIDFRTPAYGYADEHGNVAVVMEVTNIEDVDLSAELVAYVVNKELNKELNIYREGDNRIIAPEGNVILGYNDTRLVAVSNSSAYASNEFILSALQRPLLDLSIFEGNDAAYYVNLAKLYNIVNKTFTETKAEYEKHAATNSSFAQRVKTMDEVLAQLSQLKPNISDEANAIATLNFEAGRATLKGILSGVDAGVYGEITKACTNEHLEYINADAPIVANLGINGAKLAEGINLILQNPLFVESQYNTNEVNMTISVVCDALKSISGDLTIALENLKGRKDYYGNVAVEGADLAVMATVTDDYIINNLGQFIGGFLTRKDSHHYYGSFFGLDISLCQDDSIFHAGINTTYDKKSPSALDAAWYSDVKDSFAYIVTDIDSLMECSYMVAINKEVMRILDYEYRNFYTTFVDMCDYLYISQTGTYSMEAALVFEDKESNALKQIADKVMPAVTMALIANM